MRISDWSSDVCSSDLGEIDEIPAPDLVRTVPAQDPDHPDPAVDPGRVPAVRPAQRRAHQLRRGRAERERRRTPADRLAAVVHPDPAVPAAAAHPPGARRPPRPPPQLGPRTLPAPAQHDLPLRARAATTPPPYANQ